ncbi:SCO-spondin [Portunus trituberculatus]|uniref:SCO-spondin n=1 Tax=Portunus trituberculatus TaxID=210409 RepID=A0A5B7CEL8_PORTR|nr:SCO-spondin [Portunus trituberculatus]
MQRTFYPTEQFSRYRRNYLDDESSPFPGYPGFSGTASFRGGKGGRKGGPRVGSGSRGSASFPGFGGGPDAFLEEATTERIAPEDDSMASFQFNGMSDFSSLLGGSGGPRPPGASQVGVSGSSFGFPDGPSNTFGNRDSPPGFFSSGSTFDTRPAAGRPGVPGPARPGGAAEGGASVFTGSGQGGVLRLPSTGSSFPRFGGSQNSFFGGDNSGSSPNRSPNSNGFMSPFLPSFSEPNSGFSNAGNSPFGSPGTRPFGSPGGGSRLPPANRGFNFPTDVQFPNLLSQNLGDPLDGGPYGIPDELRVLFGDLSTTVKPPLRVTSAEDTDRVFPGNDDREPDNEDEDYGEGHEDVLRERIPLNFKSNFRRPLEPNREAFREMEENNPPPIEHEGLVGEHRPTAPPVTEAPPPAVRKLPGTCFTWSNSHYKTFDGKVYSFESTCPYTFLRDVTHGTFSVNLRSTPNCEGVSCNRTIQMFLEDEEYVLGLSGESQRDSSVTRSTQLALTVRTLAENGQPSLEYKDTSLAIPGHMNGVVSERVAHFVVLKVSGLGLTLKWDMKNLVVADVSEVLWNRTGGLCGQRDGKQDNDWSHADGSTEYSLSAFVQGWQAKLIGERCLDQPHVRHPCSRPSPTDPAVTFCSRLQTDPKFADCRQVVDVEPFVRACRWDYCSCRNQNREGCACSSLDAFFRECASVGMTVPGGWRSQDLCPMTCSNGKVYNPCMSAIQARCGQPAETVQPDFCVEGCDCPPGLVLHGDVCVRAEDCPCTYHDKEYNAGDSIPNDCNSW